MSISVLATKCRFCGENVGKPKEETRELSVNDLGGETIHHRAPSGSVMEALEAFRLEDGSSGGGIDDLTGVPSIDSLASDYMDSSLSGSAQGKAKAAAGKPAESQLKPRLILLAKVAAGLLVVVVAATQIPKFLKNQEQDASARPPTYVNEAPGILASGGAPIDALAAAVKAIEENPGAQSNKILEDMLQAVAGQVNELLNTHSWTMSKLQEASTIATKAVELHSNSMTVNLKREVDQENADYRMILTNINRVDDEFTFKMNDPGLPPQTVKRSDGLAAGRFRITTVVSSRTIKLVDEKRNNRVLVCDVGGSPKAQG